MDEGMQNMNLSALCFYTAPIVKELTSFSIQQRTKIFSRVKDILTKGFLLVLSMVLFFGFLFQSTERSIGLVFC